MTDTDTTPTTEIKNTRIDQIDSALGLAIYVFIKRAYMNEIDIKRIARRFRITESIVAYELKELSKLGIFKK